MNYPQKVAKHISPKLVVGVWFVYSSCDIISKTVNDVDKVTSRLFLLNNGQIKGTNDSFYFKITLNIDILCF